MCDFSVDDTNVTVNTRFCNFTKQNFYAELRLQSATINYQANF